MPGAAPAPWQLDAPAHWRAVDFLSDLHLCEQMPRTFEAWAAHLRHTDADAVFMLGDLFELWVGDDMAALPFQRRCLQVMAEVAAEFAPRRTLGFMVGNRDFLFGEQALREAGLLALPDPTVLAAWGQRWLLSHGDALCLDDAPYQAFRTQVRSPAWQQAFLARPLSERLDIAARMREASMSRREFDGDAAADVDTPEALRWLHAAGSQTLIHGHTHRPAQHELAPGRWRHVLSDWDLDHGHRAEVLRLTPGGLQRRPPAGLP